MPRLKHILFPVEFSRPCARMAREVAAVTNHFKASLTLVHTVSTPVFPDLSYPGDLYSALRKEIRQASTDLMDRFVARHFPSLTLSRVIEEGHAAEVIVDYSQKHKIDLIMTKRVNQP